MKKSKININFRSEWVKDFGDKTLYMGMDIVDCHKIPRLVLLVSTVKIDGFNAVALKGSLSGYCFGYSKTIIDRTFGFLKKDQDYYCELETDDGNIKRYDGNIKRYHVREGGPWNDVFIGSDPVLTFNVGVLYGNNGRNAISELNKTEFLKYCAHVDRITGKSKKTDYFKTTIDPNNLLKVRKDDGTSANHLDHMYSKHFGFYENTPPIPPEIIGSVANFEVLTARQNESKGITCSISREKLIERFNGLDGALKNGLDGLVDDSQFSIFE